MDMYSTLYDTINELIFGNSLVVGTYQDLIANLMTGIGVVFIVALPFALVIKMIKLITGN